MSFNRNEFMCHLVFATRLDTPDEARLANLSGALGAAADMTGLRDQLEAIRMIADVAETVSHIIATQPDQQ